MVQRKEQGILVGYHFGCECAFRVPGHEVIVGELDDDDDVRDVIDDAVEVDLVGGVEFVEQASLHDLILVNVFDGGGEDLLVVLVGDEDVVLEEFVEPHLLELLLLAVVGVPALLDFPLEGLEDRIVLLLYLS